MQWLVRIKHAVADALAVLAIDLPAIIDRLGRPSSPSRSGRCFCEALAQPLLWLAVAALVFGSAVLSLAELWRKGQPYAAAGPRRQRLRPLRRASGPCAGSARRPRGVRLAAAADPAGLLRRPRRQVPADLPLAPAGAPGRRAVPRLLRAGLLAGARSPRTTPRPLVHTGSTGGHGFTFWVRWEPAVRRCCRRAVRDAPALPAGGGLPPLPGAVRRSASRPRPPRRNSTRQHRRGRLMVRQRSRLVRIAGGDRHGRAGRGWVAAQRGRRGVRGRGRRARRAARGRGRGGHGDGRSGSGPRSLAYDGMRRPDRRACFVLVRSDLRGHRSGGALASANATCAHQ